jgi:hypothetical protein
MAKSKVASSVATITPERAARLFRLVRLLGKGPQSRAALIRALRFNVRAFYRDLEILRTAGIEVSLNKNQYALDEPAATALPRLPFPDPGLTLGEAKLLARGRSPAHQKLRKQLKRIEK